MPSLRPAPGLAQQLALGLARQLALGQPLAPGVGSASEPQPTNTMRPTANTSPVTRLSRVNLESSILFLLESVSWSPLLCPRNRLFPPPPPPMWQPRGSADYSWFREIAQPFTPLRIHTDGSGSLRLLTCRVNTLRLTHLHGGSSASSTSASTSHPLIARRHGYSVSYRNEKRTVVPG